MYSSNLNYLSKEQFERLAYDYFSSTYFDDFAVFQVTDKGARKFISGITSHMPKVFENYSFFDGEINDKKYFGIITHSEYFDVNDIKKFEIPDEVISNYQNFFIITSAKLSKRIKNNIIDYCEIQNFPETKLSDKTDLARFLWRDPKARGKYSNIIVDKSRHKLIKFIALFLLSFTLAFIYQIITQTDLKNSNVSEVIISLIVAFFITLLTNYICQLYNYLSYKRKYNKQINRTP